MRHYAWPKKKKSKCYGDTESLVSEFLSTGSVTKIINSKYGLNKDLDKKLKEFYASDEWKQKRREIFSMHPRVCNYCNSTEQLQVDHKLPLRYYWERRLQEDNLQILCKECNYQKGNHRYDELPRILEYKRIVYKDPDGVSEKELDRMLRYITEKHAAARRGDYGYGE